MGASWYDFCLFYYFKSLTSKTNQGNSKRREVRETAMDEAKLGDKLNELVREVGGMMDPQYKKLAILAKQAHDNHKRLKKSVDSLQESLDYLRICIKYQLFDLEATRRENRYLRKILEEKDS